MGKWMPMIVLVAGVGLAVALRPAGPAEAAAQTAPPPVPLAIESPAPPDRCLACERAGFGPAATDATPAAVLQRLRAVPARYRIEPLPPAQPAPVADALSDLSRPYFAPTPEPESWAMLLGGLLLVGSRLRRRRYLATL